MEHIGKKLNIEKYLRRAVPSANLPIRRREKKTRSWIDNELQEKGYTAILPKATTIIYYTLAKYANARTQTCFPSTETIMKMSGVKNQRTAIDSIRILEQHNIIAVQRTKGKVVNHFALLDCSVWEPPNRGIVATVMSARKKKATVAKELCQPWQTVPSNRGTDATLSHISNSYKKEIISEKEKIINPIFIEQKI